MRKLILILFILPFIGFSQSETEIEYWENGRVLSQIQYVDGIENGPFRYYHENGKLWREGNYKDGEEEGIRKEYYENGQLWTEENFKDGKEEGFFRDYHENGKVVWEGNFKNGKLINQKCWDANGSKIECD